MTHDPLMDEGLQNWIRATAYKRAWQLQGYEPEDLIQEAYICYSKCRDRYSHNFSNPPTKDDLKWFMSLVKTTVHNHITSLARQQMRRPNLTSMGFMTNGDDTYEDSYTERSPSENKNVDPGMAGLVDIFLSAPAEVREILIKILLEGQDVLTMKRREAIRLSLEGPKKRRLRFMETTNQKLCELVGADPEAKNYHREILNLVKKV